MIHTRFALLLILAFVVYPDYARAQQNTSQPTNAALREKALNLLESAAGQLSTLQSPENRARLGANIADSLWTHDEKRARAVVSLVQDDINAGLANRDLDDPTDAHTIKVFLKLRRETVERIAKYDAELALAFLKSTEFVSDKPLPPEIAESEQGLEARLARQMATNSPAQAVKLARKSLTHGFSEELIPLLRLLRKKDKEQALILYKEIVKKLRDTDLAENWQVRQFAENLAQRVSPPTPEAFRDLIGIFITRALDHGCGNALDGEDPRAQFCEWVGSILPHMDSIDPRAARLKRWVRLMEIKLLPEAIHEWFDMAEGGSIEDVLAYAARHPEVAQEVYWDAIRRAGSAGDLEQARKILTQHIADSERKQAALAELERRIKSSGVDDKIFEEIQSQMKDFSGALERVRHLLAYADHYGAYDRKTALKLIRQATEVIDLMSPGKDQVEAQLALAKTYGLLKDDRGFAIIESLMPKLNELVDAAVKLDGYETRYVRDGEWNMSANGTIGVILTDLSQNAGNFAWSDFDRAVSLSSQFERTEIRLMAQVKLAQAILAGPRPRPEIAVDYLYH